MSAEPTMSTPSAEEFEKLNQRLIAMGFPQQKLLDFSHYMGYRQHCGEWVQKCEKHYEDLKVLLKREPKYLEVIYSIYATE
jgi:hypothetical protein